ncbi:cation transporter [Palaeococcus sp. (in: euryarchaeotes)]
MDHSHRVKGMMLFSIALNIIITLAEIVEGLLSGSLALLRDSVHNFSDSMSLLVSYLAISARGP